MRIPLPFVAAEATWLALAVAIYFSAASAHAACFPVPNGLLGFWRGEGDASDEFGNNHGTVAGGVTFGAGEVGQAFVLNGNGGTAVKLADATPFQLQDLTIEAWVKRASASIASHDVGGGHIF